MILIELRNYLKDRVTASMVELSMHFKKHANDLEPLLQYWIDRGRVESVDAQCGGGSCQGCPMRCAKAYRYVSSKNTLG